MKDLEARSRQRGRPSEEGKQRLVALECLTEAKWEEDKARNFYCARAPGERDTTSRQFTRAFNWLNVVFNRN
jgi:hypothetical protein